MVGKVPKRNPRKGIDEYGRTKVHYAETSSEIEKLVNYMDSHVRKAYSKAENQAFTYPPHHPVYRRFHPLVKTSETLHQAGEFQASESTRLSG